jgi:Holliday junction resolvase RusA-like endonuclease
MQAAHDSRVATYPEGTTLECTLRLALEEPRLRIQDVDNLLKHVFDALQGRLGGSKTRPPQRRLIPNDHQVRKVLVEKVRLPDRKYGSQLIVRKYTRRSGKEP